MSDRTDASESPALPPRTSPRSPRGRRGGLSTVVLAALVGVSLLYIGAVAVVATGGRLPSVPLPTTTKETGSNAPAYLYFTVTTSAATDYDTYYPANVTVPVNQPIIVTITSYDPGVNNVSSPYTQVQGTIGGSATYNLGTGAAPRSQTMLPNGEISHTFTIVYPGAASQLQVQSGTPILNVPVPVSPNGIIPASVEFTMEFSSTGHYVWTCLAPCDPYSMNTPGFMIGAIEVV